LPEGGRSRRRSVSAPAATSRTTQCWIS
jgi:hypothetical protein